MLSARKYTILHERGELMNRDVDENGKIVLKVKSQPPELHTTNTSTRGSDAMLLTAK